jgi:hypothetical protein
MFTAYARDSIPLEVKLKNIAFWVYMNKPDDLVTETIKNALDTFIKYDELAITYDPLDPNRAHCVIEVLESTDTDRFIEQLKSELFDGFDVSAVPSLPRCR